MNCNDANCTSTSSGGLWGIIGMIENFVNPSFSANGVYVP